MTQSALVEVGAVPLSGLRRRLQDCSGRNPGRIAARQYIFLCSYCYYYCYYCLLVVLRSIIIIMLLRTCMNVQTAFDPCTAADSPQICNPIYVRGWSL